MVNGRLPAIPRERKVGEYQLSREIISRREA